MTMSNGPIGKIILSLLLVIAFNNPVQAVLGCTGRVINPVTDVCWSCLLPIKVMGIPIAVNTEIDTPSPKDIICFCSRPKVPVPVPGIPISFWEPARLVEVTKAPMCMVSLGGVSLGTTPQRGMKEDGDGAFYHVHWYVYPVLYWLELLLDFVCLEMHSVDLAYLTEFDPFWGDDTKNSILNPEALLFANPIAVAACSADCLISSVGISSDLLFWCSGCQGCLYPFGGTTSYHNGGVGTAQLTVTKFIAKMHRELMLWGYVGNKGLCGKYPMPIIRKSQYRLQMIYPVPEFFSCKRIGQTEVLWQAGREFPIFGEDFSFLIWRKRDCCLF